MKPRSFVVASIMIVCTMAASTTRATEAAWARLATGGYTILMSHALAPGVGDPPYFDLEDCSTQRNLSDRGRQLARRQGVRFAARAVSISRVYSSRWCRTLETAENAFRDLQAEPLAALDSIGEGGDDQSADIIEIIRAFRGPGNQVMVTHPEVVEMLTGSMPRAGESIIVAPSRDGDGVDVVARLLLN